LPSRLKRLLHGSSLQRKCLERNIYFADAASSRAATASVRGLGECFPKQRAELTSLTWVVTFAPCAVTFDEPGIASGQLTFKTRIRRALVQGNACGRTCVGPLCDWRNEAKLDDRTQIAQFYKSKRMIGLDLAAF
jgi:hypothetical protein